MSVLLHPAEERVDLLDARVVAHPLQPRQPVANAHWSPLPQPSGALAARRSPAPMFGRYSFRQTGADGSVLRLAFTAAHWPSSPLPHDPVVQGRPRPHHPLGQPRPDIDGIAASMDDGATAGAAAEIAQRPQP